MKSDEKAADPVSAHPPQLLLPRNLSALAKVCNKDEHRYGAMSAVSLTRNEDGTYIAVATDGKRLATVTGPAEETTKYPDLPVIASAPNGATTVAIGAKDWLAAFKGMPKRCAMDKLAVVMSQTVTTLVSTDFNSVNAQTPRNVEGRFPDWNRCFSNKKPALTISVDPSLMADMMDCARAFTDDTEKRVTLEFQDAITPIRIRAQNAEGQKFDGLLVPLTATSESKCKPKIEDQRALDEATQALENASRTIHTLREELAESEKVNALLRANFDALQGKLRAALQGE